MRWKTLDDMDLAGKRVLVRVDINVPVENGRVSDTTRIERIVPTVRDILAAGAQPILQRAHVHGPVCLAHRLEHLHRYDVVVLPADVAVVLQAQVHPPARPRPLHAPPGPPELLP